MCVRLAAPSRVCEVFVLPALFVLIGVLLDERKGEKAKMLWPLMLPDVTFVGVMRRRSLR